MSNEVVDAIIERVKEHCSLHDQKFFEFVFHGGEPLLAPREFFKSFVGKARERLKGIKVGFTLQTNGVLLDNEWCKTLGLLDISVGVSIDGLQETHDLHRKYHNGNGSYYDTIRGLKIAQNSPFLRNNVGILMVIDVESDPVEVYNQLRFLGTRYINFLLPYGNYENTPTGLLYQERKEGKTLYADWLIEIFNIWWHSDQKIEIRIFKQVVELILGIDNGFEYWGQRRSEFLVIETDGSIEAVGALKLCGHGFTKADMNVLNNTIDDALETELAKNYQLSHEILCQQCQECPVVEVCGGGFFPHRYRSSNGFNNPSVYCLNLLKLITHIQNVVLDTMPKELISEGEMEKLTFSIIKEEYIESFTYI